LAFIERARFLRKSRKRPACNPRTYNGEAVASDAPGMSSEPAADFIAKHKVA
jgi:hypothetical protein